MDPGKANRLLIENQGRRKESALGHSSRPRSVGDSNRSPVAGSGGVYVLEGETVVDWSERIVPGADGGGMPIRVRSRDEGWSSDQVRTVDALAQTGEEGRGKLRKASGSCKQAWIRGCPNGETRRE